MMKSGQSRIVLFVLAAALVSFGWAGPASGAKKNNNDNGAQQAIKRVQEEIKELEARRKSAQEQMKVVKQEGDKLQPTVEPAKKQLRFLKQEMEDQQRERGEASREMQEKIASDPEIEKAGAAADQAEQARDRLRSKLMPGIESEEGYQRLAKKLDEAQAQLDQFKREGRSLDVPAAATLLATAQGELGSFVETRLAEDEDYKVADGELSQAQAHKRETEKRVSEKYRGEADLESLDATYEVKREAYREQREALRELESKVRALTSAYRDAEDEVSWCDRRISLRKSRIESLKRSSK